MKKALLILAVAVLIACGGTGGSSSPVSDAHAAPGDVPFVLLGGVVDQNQIWSTSGDVYWHEVGSSNYEDGAGNYYDYGNGTFRVSRTPDLGEQHKVSVMLHIRSGTGGCHGRLYNKVRIVRTAPTREVLLAINSEALIEFADGCVRFFDASRTVFAIDQSPAPNAQNVYAVEIVAGDGTHTEVSYGSPLIVEKFQ